MTITSTAHAVALTIGEVLFFQKGDTGEREDAVSLTTVVLPSLYDYKVAGLRTKVRYF